MENRMTHVGKVLVAVLAWSILASGAMALDGSRTSAVDSRVDSLLVKMTLEEKIGQLVQLTFREKSRQDSAFLDPALEQLIRSGGIGSFLNTVGADLTGRTQKIALEESRLKIPLLFGLDVVHGFRTVFPIPLAEASTWEPELVRQTARIAAVEASASGIHWTFAPMVDIARDPRWGRIAEGSGEDPYLGAMMAAARVIGFQTERLDDFTSLLACPKHFAGYGAAEGGRDYNTAEISERTLREIYLPPFEAAMKAGAATTMCSFNEIGGVPSSGNAHLLTEILRQEWGFQGFVVSDWGSIPEMVQHGFAATPSEAARQAITVGVDMDMEGNVYREHLAALVRSGKVPETVLDQAVRRVLRAKFLLGLFDHPYRGAGKEREAKIILSPGHRALARESARKSLVLLRNEGDVLPLRKDLATLAVIGPLAEDTWSILGPWSAMGRSGDAVSVLEGIRRSVGKRTAIIHEKGCDVSGTSTTSFAAAIEAVKKADAAVVVVGEESSMSGEAASRATLGLPGIQEQLVAELAKLGKPLVVVLFNGRPLALSGIQTGVPAILETWFSGIEGGNAIADVLFGDAVPSGKLPVTFPCSVGQIPLYYNHKNTGRPAVDSVKYTSKYLDQSHEPLYPFGYGLSYTRFTYRDLKLSAQRIRAKQNLSLSVEVTNSGSRAGVEVVQLYLHDLTGSFTRPVKELKGFTKVALRPGEKSVVTFILTAESLSMLDRNFKPVVEPGAFEVQVGGNSRDVLSAAFDVIAE
jgi:beta-glucosidase